MSQLSLSVAAALDRQWAPAVAAAEEAIRISRTERVTGDFLVMTLAAHARALLGAGDVRGAVAVSAEAIAVGKRQGQPAQQCEATLAHVGCLRELQGDAARETIESLLDEASRLIDETGAERWRPHLCVERAELYRLRGDPDAAKRELDEAHRRFTEMGATGHAGRIARLLRAPDLAREPPELRRVRRT